MFGLMSVTFLTLHNLIKSRGVTREENNIFIFKTIVLICRRTNGQNVDLPISGTSPEVPIVLFMSVTDFDNLYLSAGLSSSKSY